MNPITLLGVRHPALPSSSIASRLAATLAVPVPSALSAFDVGLAKLVANSYNSDMANAHFQHLAF
jgi:hypothetical protein